MSHTQLVTSFAAIGARLMVYQVPQIGGPLRIVGGEMGRRRAFDLDVLHDRRGERFRLNVTPHAPVMRVLQANRPGRHLLLHVTGAAGGERLLCGHDERHWFVAAVEGRVSTISDAKRALLPAALRDAGLSADVIARRHTAAFKRQGEWFFVPTTRDLSAYPVLHGEPLVRNTRSKPHMVAEIVRFGGTPVVLFHRQEYTPEAWEAYRQDHPGASGRFVMKDPEVYARGSVRHPDHATLILPDWHRVYPNRETSSVNVSFYD